MGIKVTPELVRLMGAEDQRRYGDPGFHPADDPHPPPKTGKLEREEQRQFASWLMLKGFKAKVWHRTDTATGANPGVPDFILPVWNGITLWIEFKQAHDSRFSQAQIEFQAALEKVDHIYHVVYSALEAIELVRRYTPLYLLDLPASKASITTSSQSSP